MVLETDLDTFRGLSLILQHRALVQGLDTIEAAICTCQSSDATERETALRLLPLLRGFAQALPEHFAAEARSTGALLRDSQDPEFARAIEQLDGEHPRLLACFEAAVERLAAEMNSSAGELPLPSFERAIAELLTSIDEFRQHEAREDALFVD